MGQARSAASRGGRSCPPHHTAERSFCLTACAALLFSVFGVTSCLLRHPCPMRPVRPHRGANVLASCFVLRAVRPYTCFRFWCYCLTASGALLLSVFGVASCLLRHPCPMRPVRPHRRANVLACFLFDGLCGLILVSVFGVTSCLLRHPCPWRPVRHYLFPFSVLSAAFCSILVNRVISVFLCLKR